MDPTLPPLPAASEADAPLLAQRLQGSFGEDSVTAMLDALALAGIEVTADDLSAPLRRLPGPASRVRLMRLQARNMALELSAGQGFAGATLDQLVPDTGAPFGLSRVLVAYVQSADTFGAKLSRALLQEQDLSAPESVIFPSVTLMTFLADIYPDRGSTAQPLQLGVRRQGLGDPCGEINSVLEGLSSMAAGAIAPDSGGVVFGVIESAISSALDLALDAVRGALRQLLRPIQALAVLAGAATSLRVWTVQLRSDPGKTHYQVEGDPEVAGKFTATVTGDSDFTWPQQVESCAALLGLQLPDRMGAPGSSVEWKEVVGFPSRATVVGKEVTVAEDRTAKLDFRVAQESRTNHLGGGLLLVGAGIVEAKVAREDLSQLHDLVTALFGSSQMSAIVSNLTETVVSGIEDLVSPRGIGSVLLTFHTGARNASVAFSAPGFGGTITFDGYSCTGAAGQWQGTITLNGMANGSGMVSWTFPSSGSTPTNFSGPTFPVTGTVAGEADPTGVAATLGGTSEAPTITWSGVMTVTSGPNTFPGQWSGTSPIQFGARDECP